MAVTYKPVPLGSKLAGLVSSLSTVLPAAGLYYVVAYLNGFAIGGPTIDGAYRSQRQTRKRIKVLQEVVLVPAYAVFYSPRAPVGWYYVADGVSPIPT